MAGEDPEYLRWLRLQPCALAPFCGRRGCHAHHARHGVGMGRRDHDHRAVALCPGHHDDFHDGRGVFAEMSREERRQWMEDQIARCRALYEATLREGDIPF